MRLNLFILIVSFFNNNNNNLNTLLSNYIFLKNRLENK
jgi:hypothetical protein